MDDQGPGAVGLDPPAPLFLLDEEGHVVVEPVFVLRAGVRAAIPNPWSQGQYVLGVVAGLPGRFLLDVGRSLGKLELRDEGYRCVALAKMSAIAEGLETA